MIATSTFTLNAEPGHMTLATAFQQLSPQWVRLPACQEPDRAWFRVYTTNSGWLILCHATQNLTTGEITHTPIRVDELPLFNPESDTDAAKLRV